MPDLTSMLLRRSVGSLEGGRQRCSDCRRTPLTGERLHELESGRVVCELCVSALPEADRAAAATRRVHTSERRLAVAPRAA